MNLPEHVHDKRGPGYVPVGTEARQADSDTEVGVEERPVVDTLLPQIICGMLGQVAGVALVHDRRTEFETVQPIEFSTGPSHVAEAHAETRHVAMKHRIKANAAMPVGSSALFEIGPRLVERGLEIFYI